MSKPAEGSAPRQATRRPRPNPNTSQRPTSRSTHTSKPRTSPRSGARGVRPAKSTFRARHPVITALVPALLVMAIIATMVVIKASGGSPAASSSSHGGPVATTNQGATALSPAVLASVASVSPSTFEAVGSPASVLPPTRLGSDSPVLRGADGKPIVTYVGAEYCPYCAAERWALAVALSRFGTFSNLSGTQSSASDVYPNTQTLSFYRSAYSSPYVEFEAVEETSNHQVNGVYQTLQVPTARQRALMSRYDTAGSIPFLDIANRYVITGASYSPQVLQGLSRTQIAQQLNDPTSPVAQAIIGTANQITAAISAVTRNQPNSVSSSPTIAAIEKNLEA